MIAVVYAMVQPLQQLTVRQVAAVVNRRYKQFETSSKSSSTLHKHR